MSKTRPNGDINPAVGGRGRKRRKKEYRNIGTAKTAPARTYRGKSGSMSKGFDGTVGVTWTAQDGGTVHGQSGDMGQRIQVGSTAAVANPKAFLTGSLKAGVVSFTFSTQGISALELRTISVNGKAVVVGNGFVFGAAQVFLAIVPVFVVAGAGARFGLPEGAAKFLACASVVRGFSIFVHGKASVAKEIANRQLFRVFDIVFVQRDNGVSLIDIFYQVIDGFHIVALVTQEVHS